MKNIKQKVSDKKSGLFIAVEECVNGEWSWYYNEMSGNRLERLEGEGRVIADFELEYLPL